MNQNSMKQNLIKLQMKLAQNVQIAAQSKSGTAQPASQAAEAVPIKLSKIKFK
jgi:hypothetical protein